MHHFVSLFCSRAEPPASAAGRSIRIDLLCLSAAIVACGLTLPSLANAAGMRCGTKLVSDGDTLYEVQARCGEPKFKVRRVEQRTVRSWVSTPCVTPGTQCGRIVERTVEVQIDEWTYDFGSTQFVRYVTFEDGRLLRVDTGSYGSE